MKLRNWVTVGACFLGIYGCGDISRNSENDSQRPGTSGDQVMPVDGSLLIGSRCQDGSIMAPQPVPLEVYRCPLNNLRRLPLAESLGPITLKADCKLRLLDIQKLDRSSLTTWEFMPNGSFDIIIDGGIVKLKNDGNSAETCGTPVMANLFGHVDCTDPLKPKIYLDSAWYLNETIQVAMPQPSANPSAMPSDMPSSIPAAFASGLPSGIPSVSPSGAPAVVIQPSNRPSFPAGLRRCDLPKGCYLFNEVRVDQCS